MKYAIKLPNRKGYLCHAGTNRAVIYDDPTGFPIAMDITSSGGKRVAVEGEVMSEIYAYNWYDNQPCEIEDPVESLFEYKGHHRVQEDATVYM